MSDHIHIDRVFLPLTTDELASTEHLTNGAGQHSDAAPILPVPQNAMPPRFRHVRLGEASATWRYRDRRGETLGFVARFDPASERKQFFPLTYWNDERGAGWRWKSWPTPRPLYGLDKLTTRPNAPVIVAEGEKAADAAAQIFPDHVAVTSPNGSEAADKADWTPLAGRNVIVWPDADEPGKRYAGDVANMLRRLEVGSVRLVKVPSTFRDGWDLADELPPGIGQADLARMLEHSDAAGHTDHADDPWRSPDLTILGSGRRVAPAFPLELLETFWSAWVARKADGASAARDYVAVSLLASAGAALANVRWPVAGANWSEPPILWCGLVGSPSSGKSPAMDAAFDMVRQAEDRMAAGHDEERRRFEADKQAAEARRDAWKVEVKAAVKAGGNPPRMPADAEEPAAPVRPRIRVADTTTERLGALAAALPRGLLLVRDELSGWLGAFDKYGGGGADRAFAIEMYGGRSYVVDRMKNPEPLHIRHLSVGVLGGVQPDKLPGLIEGPDDGLASRVLWTWPEAPPGFSLTRAIADESESRNAFSRLTDLAQGSDEFGYPEPKRLRLSDKAEDAIEAFARDIAMRANDASGIFASTLGKARGHALRLALVLEHLWWCGASARPEPAIITEKAVLAAAGLVDGYFVPMAERVYGDAAIPAFGTNRHGARPSPAQSWA